MWRLQFGAEKFSAAARAAQHMRYYLLCAAIAVCTKTTRVQIHLQKQGKMSPLSVSLSLDVKLINLPIDWLK